MVEIIVAIVSLALSVVAWRFPVSKRIAGPNPQRKNGRISGSGISPQRFPQITQN
jgi:hypothetical protein